MSLHHLQNKGLANPGLKAGPGRAVFTIFLLLASLLFTSGLEAAPAALAGQDLSTIDGILKALYETISGPAGQARDWERFRSLFVPGARLIPARVDTQGKATTRAFDVEGFIKAAEPYYLKNGFFEQEISRRMERFGNIAHVFSTYESRNKASDAKPFARGINSIQLFWNGSQWQIVTIYWEGERPNLPIPKQYLKKH